MKFKVGDRVHVTLVGTITEVDENYPSLPYKVAIADLTDGAWVSGTSVALEDEDEDDTSEAPAQQEPLLQGDAFDLFAPQYSVQYKYSSDDLSWASLASVPEIAAALRQGDFNALVAVVGDRARTYSGTSPRFHIFRIVHGTAEKALWANHTDITDARHTAYRQVVSRKVPLPEEEEEEEDTKHHYAWGYFATEGAAARFVEWAAQQEPAGSDWEYCIISPYAPADVTKLPYTQFRNFVSFSRSAPVKVPPPVEVPKAPVVEAAPAPEAPIVKTAPARTTVPSLGSDYTVVGHRYLVEVDGEELNDEGWEELEEALEALSDSIYEGSYENSSRRGTIRRCPIVLLKD